VTSRYRIYVDHGLTGANRDRPGLRLALAACRAGGARAKISLPVSALKQDDDALSLINFFATGNRPRPNANYRRSRRRCALAKFRTHSTCSPNLACSL